MDDLLSAPYEAEAALHNSTDVTIVPTFLVDPGVLTNKAMHKVTATIK